MTYADGYNAAVAKACEWIRTQTDLGVSERYDSDGRLLSEDYIRDVHESLLYLESVIDDFKRFMEE